MAFFPDLTWEETVITPLPRGTGISIKNYFSQLLLDLAHADPSIGQQAEQRAMDFANLLQLSK